MKKSIFIFLLASFLLVGCHDFGLWWATKSYDGDGEISYTGGILTSPGITIMMPEFDLSRDHQTTYSLRGAPKSKYYIVYLVVPDSSFINAATEGEWEYVLVKDDKPIASFSTKRLSEITDNIIGNVHRFYFYPSNLIIGNDSYYSIHVRSKNNSLKQTVQAHVEIEFGGYK